MTGLGGGSDTTGPSLTPMRELGGADPVARSVAAMVQDRLFAAAAAAPPRFGRFVLLGHIGQGGMGVVFMAYDPQLDRNVALKLQRTEGSDDRQTRRAQREAQALARLAHPNIVPVFEAGEQDGKFYLAMELVRGRTLDAWRREHPEADWRAVLDVLLQAGEGLAAAHGAGVVHRDFKPSNVIVGEDGRVRVMDFGLARFVAIDDVAAGGAPATGAVGVTQTTVLGTPGYMAPEQRQLGIADASSDIYSFCVVLCELLYRVAPADDAAAVCAEAQRRQVPGREVPAWLGAIVLRGLQADPRARWPSMRALLAALADDPIVRRRQRVRLVGLILLVATLATAAVLGGLAGYRWLTHQAAERLAADHLEAIDLAEDPEAAFERFLAADEHRGTRAMAQAWQRRGARARARGSTADALAAYARAYVEVVDPDDALTTIRALAELFQRTWNGPALARAARDLRAHGVDDEAVAAYELDAALDRRDLTGAIEVLGRMSGTADAAWRPMLAELAGARPLGVDISRYDALPPGEAAAYAALTTKGILLMDRDHAPLRLIAGGTEIIPGTALALRGDRLVALDAPGTVLRRLGGVPIRRIASFPLADGRPPALIFSRHWPELGFRRIDGPQGGIHEEEPAHRTTDRAASSLEATWVGDLDGDGHTELFAAFGPWDAFDLRVFRADERGALQMVARRREGYMTAMTAVLWNGERLLAVVVDDTTPAPTVFPEPPHTGGPAGVHLLRWTGAALVAVAHLPFPASEASLKIGAGDRLLAGDFDADGAEDLSLSVRVDGKISLLLIRQAADGAAAMRRIGGLWLMAAVQADDDLAAELIVQTESGDGAWILGAGGTAPPVLTIPEPATATPFAADPWLAARATQAGEIAAMGLAREAAAAFVDLAVWATDPPTRQRMLAQAAELWVAAGDDTAAVALDARLVDDPEVGAAALARSAEALVRLGRYAEAHQAASRLAANPGRSDAEAALAGRVLAQLAPLLGPDERIVLDFSRERPWGPVAGPAAALRVLRPAGLRHDVAGAALEVTVAAGRAPLAELAFERTGESVVVELELTVHRVEAGACLNVALTDEAGAVWMIGGVCGQAGDDVLLHGIRCNHRDLHSPNYVGEKWRVGSALAPRRVAVRIAAFADGSFECIGDEGDRAQRLAQPGPVRDLPRRMRLVLGSMEPGPRPALAEAALHRVVVYGGRLVAPTEVSAWDLAARHLVEGDLLAAQTTLAGLAPADARERLILVDLFDRLGDVAGLGRALGPAVPDLLGPALLPDVALLVRDRPLAAGLLQAAASARLLPTLAEVWSGLAAHRGDASTRAAALQGLAGVHLLAPTSQGELVALRRLLVLRALLAEHDEQPERAVRDLEDALALGPAAGDESLGELHLTLARLLAGERPLLAGWHAREAVVLSDTPELVVDRLQVDPALAGLTDAPGFAARK